MTTHRRSKPTAREKLQQDQLTPAARAQTQGIRDVEVDRLRFYLKDALTIETADMVTDARISRTIEGASTVTVDIVDDDRTFLRSGRLSQDTDIEIDGLWFRMAGFDKAGKNLSVTFEDRPVAILRTYHKKMGPIPRTQITRAEFVLRMIKEVKEFPIPYYIPELHSVQPIARDKHVQNQIGGNRQAGASKGQGIPHGAGYRSPHGSQAGENPNPLTVGTAGMNNTQIDIANAILDTGVSNGARRKVLVVAIMVAIQESRIRNLRADQSPKTKDAHGQVHKHIGVFQQDPRYWPASRDIVKDATAFFAAAIGIDRDSPNIHYFDLAERVQQSGQPLLYSQWRYEAERIVKAYGILGADNEAGRDSQRQFNISGGKEFFFYRGIPPQGQSQWGREDSWTCINRLGREVHWRGFFVAGEFYFVTEDFLFNAFPVATIHEFDVGINDIQIQFDQARKYAQVKIPCEMNRWAAPPGTVIEIQDCGPIDGKWLVTTAERSFFNPHGEITLLKPEPKLKEPARANLKLQQDFVANQTNTADAVTGVPTGGSAQKGAQQIIHYFNQGKYRDGNGRQMSQWRKVAKGQKLRNQCGVDVSLNPAVSSAIVYLINQGYWIGTFAICEDHRCNGGQHPLGQAIDISHIGTPLLGWRIVGDKDPATTRLMKEVMRILESTAWDLICNGNGQQDATVQALQVDNQKIRGGHWWSGHIDHIHYGVAPSPSGTKT